MLDEIIKLNIDRKAESFLRAEVIEKYGGSPGLRDATALDSAVPTGGSD